MTDSSFDGDAISRADREFLESLGDHYLVKHPFYGIPCPPQPAFGDPRHDDAQATAARHAAHEKTVTWLVVNYGYHESAFAGKGGAISLVDGEVMTLANLRERMMPWPLLTVGPRGAIKARSPVEDWRMSRDRLSIRREEMRPDQPRPTFAEDRYQVFNRYRPPVHPSTGGELATFERFMARLFPDEAERTWFRHWLAHKTRKPWIPMIGIIMVAEEFGSGRGTLFDILELLFGADYVVPCSFAELAGTSSTARFNARIADALIAVVNEAIAEDGQLQAQRRLQYEVLKNTVEPSPTARQRYEGKYQHAYTQRSARSVVIATNHADVIKLPAEDRRLEVLTCGRKMTAAETDEIRKWMAAAENIGALQRTLLAMPAVPLEVFDPFGQPPAFAGRCEMIGRGQSELEDAYAKMVDLLKDCPLFTLSQGQKLVSFLAGTVIGSGDPGRIRHTLAKHAFRLRQREEPNYRIRYRRRLEVIFAGSRDEQRRWHDASTQMIVAQLDRTEQRITEIMHAEGDPLAELLRRQTDPSAPSAAE